MTFFSFLEGHRIFLPPHLWTGSSMPRMLFPGLYMLPSVDPATLNFKVICWGLSVTSNLNVSSVKLLLSKHLPQLREIEIDLLYVCSSSEDSKLHRCRGTVLFSALYAESLAQCPAKSRLQKYSLSKLRQQFTGQHAVCLIIHRIMT